MLRARLFGALSLEVDGRPVPQIAGLKPRSVLAWLLVNPGPHARAHVAARFWPDVLDTSARASLRSALLDDPRRASGTRRRRLPGGRSRQPRHRTGRFPRQRCRGVRAAELLGRRGGSRASTRARRQAAAHRSGRRLGARGPRRLLGAGRRRRRCASPTKPRPRGICEGRRSEPARRSFTTGSARPRTACSCAGWPTQGSPPRRSPPSADWRPCSLLSSVPPHHRRPARSRRGCGPAHPSRRARPCRRLHPDEATLHSSGATPSSPRSSPPGSRRVAARALSCWSPVRRASARVASQPSSPSWRRRAVRCASAALPRGSTGRPRSRSGSLPSASWSQRPATSGRRRLAGGAGPPLSRRGASLGEAGRAAAGRSRRRASRPVRVRGRGEPPCSSPWSRLSTGPRRLGRC